MATVFSGKFEIGDGVSESDERKIYGGLLEYNLERIEDKHPREISVVLRGPDGSVSAGLTGQTHGSWLSVKYLWVSEGLRDRGVGGALLDAAEAEARSRGCRYAFCDTFSFQAPEFYKKRGYREAFTLKNYPVSGSRVYFTKEL